MWRTSKFAFFVTCIAASFACPAFAELPASTVVPRLRFDQMAEDSTAETHFELVGRDARMQFQVTLEESVGKRDLTRKVAFTVEPPNVISIDDRGFVRPLADGVAKVSATQLEDGETVLAAQANVVVRNFDADPPINFANQIVPIFTKHGCNGGGCHGKAAGQAGFKLSLLGFEPKEDYEHLVRESRGRRLFPAMPRKSLLLEKAINVSPHGGGQRFGLDSHEFRILERWIATGMPYGKESDPVVESIAVLPNARTLQRNCQQQLRVIASYSNGMTEDITRSAQFESNNSDLADVDELGLVSLANQAGDVAVMVRYQGHVAVFRATIPLGIEVNEWPVEQNFVDSLLFRKLRALGIPPSPSCDDSTFVRRVTLDLTGRLPTQEESEQFLADASPTKDAQLVDRLLASTDYAEFFAKKWSSILRNRRPTPGHQFTSFAFFEWLRDSIHENQRYDEFVRQLVAATGSIETNPAAAWLREVATTESRVEDAAQLFLGQRLQCARCHHHPFEKWSQQDYFQMAAFFSTVSKKESERREEPSFSSRNSSPSAKDPRSGKSLTPAGLDAAPAKLVAHVNPRDSLVDWMTQPENPYFSKALVNRYWKHFFAVGLVEPEDDMRVTNPPTNPELLDGLAEYFIEQDFDVKQLIRAICSSKAYRLNSVTNDHNLNDNNSYSRFYPKRVQAEVLLDAVDAVLLTSTNFDGLPPATRAVCLPDTNFSSYFLNVFGEPDSATACECERSGEATLAQSLHLLNSKEIQSKLQSEKGRAAQMAASPRPDEQLISELYFSAFSRPPQQHELATALEFVAQKTNAGGKDATEPGNEKLRREAFEDLIWALINSKEFLFNH